MNPRSTSRHRRGWYWSVDDVVVGVCCDDVAAVVAPDDARDRVRHEPDRPAVDLLGWWLRVVEREGSEAALTNTWVFRGKHQPVKWERYQVRATNTE